MRYAIQWVRTPVSLHEDVDHEDLGWETVPGLSAFTSEQAANDIRAELDEAADGSYQHRVVQVRP